MKEQAIIVESYTLKDIYRKINFLQMKYSFLMCRVLLAQNNPDYWHINCIKIIFHWKMYDVAKNH